MTPQQIERKMKRLEALATFFRERGMVKLSDEIRNLRTSSDIEIFFDVLRKWLL